MSNQSDCPPQAELMCLLLDQTPNPDWQAHLSGHLGRCTRCQTLLDSLSRVQHLEDRLDVWRRAQAEYEPSQAFLHAVPAEDGDTEYVTRGEGILVVPSSSDSSRPGELDSIDDSVSPPSATSSRKRYAGQRAGKYLLHEEIGRGGMGQAFRATHVGLERDVAVKFILADKAGSGTRDRFLREAKMLAKVKHDNVVFIHDVAEDGEDLFLVMDLLRGEPLKDRLNRQPRLALPEVLEIGRQAALGLSAIHEKGVVHRDVKPANLFLEEGGRVKVLDLGLARLVTGEARQTQPGFVVGTPSYLAPEQAEGRPTEPRADVYSLGVVLFEMLAGRLPFPGVEALEVLAAVIHKAPPSLGECCPDLPPALIELVDGMLAKNPVDRPATALAVATCLQAIAEAANRPKLDDTVKVAIPERVIPPAKKQTALSWVVTTILLTAVVAGVVIVIRHKDGKETEVEVERGSKVKLEKGGKRVIVTPPDVRKAPVEAELLPDPTTETDSVLDSLDAAKIPAAQKRKWQPRELVAVLGKHHEKLNERRIDSVTFSRTGSHLLSAGSDDHARWWDVCAGKEVASIKGQPGHGVQAALAPDDSTALLFGAHQRLRFWDLKKNVEFGTFGRDWREEVVFGVPLFSADGKQVFVAHRDAHNKGTTVRRWEVATRRELKAYGHEKYAAGLALEPNGKRLATSSQDGNLRLWDVESGKELDCIPFAAGYSSGHLAWAPDGRHLLVGAHLQSDHPDVKKGKLRPAVSIWELKGDEAKPIATYGDLTKNPVAVTWSADGRSLAYADEAGHVVVRDFATGEKRADWLLPQAVSSLAFAHDNRHLAVGTGYGAIYVLRLPLSVLDQLDPEAIPVAQKREWHPRELVAVLGEHRDKPDEHTIQNVTFSRMGSRLLSGGGGGDNHARWWDVCEGKEVASRLGQRDGGGVQVALSPDDRLALLCVPHLELRFWGVHDNTQSEPFGWDGDRGVVFGRPVFSSDGKQVLVLHRDGNLAGTTLRRWEVASRRELKAYRHPTYAQGLALEPNGKRVATSTEDGQLRLWNVDSGKELACIPLAPGFACSYLAWSPDGRYLLSGENPRNGHPAHKGGKPASAVRVWELKGDEAKPITTYADLAEHPRAVVWSPDGKSLAYADEAGHLVVRDFATGEKRGDWLLPRAVSSLAFAPDNRHLAVGSRYGAVYVLRLSLK